MHDSASDRPVGIELARAFRQSIGTLNRAAARVNSRQFDADCVPCSSPSSGLSMNNFRRSSKVRMNRTRRAAGQTSYLNVKWNRAERSVNLYFLLAGATLSLSFCSLLVLDCPLISSNTENCFAIFRLVQPAKFVSLW